MGENSKGNRSSERRIPKKSRKSYESEERIFQNVSGLVVRIWNLIKKIILPLCKSFVGITIFSLSYISSKVLFHSTVSA